VSLVMSREEKLEIGAKKKYPVGDEGEEAPW
jgi:hypothetical protein